MKSLIKFDDLYDYKTVNSMIENGMKKEMIDICEKHHIDKIDEMYKDIVSKKSKVVLITGPSSSGKTTLSGLLSKKFQKTPVVLSIDDFFYDKNEVDKSKSTYEQFETIAAVNVPLFNECIYSLLSGKKTAIPHFDFANDLSVKQSKFITLEPNQEIIIEGTHAFNEQLLNEIDDRDKYKLYIHLGKRIEIDGVLIPKRQLRLVRRSIRDELHRGCGVVRTQQLWTNVVKFEQKMIIPYLKKADYVFSSFLPYEPCVLAPILEDMLKKEQEINNVNGIVELSQLLNEYLPLDKNLIPDYSLLNEFV